VRFSCGDTNGNLKRPFNTDCPVSGFFVRVGYHPESRACLVVASMRAITDAFSTFVSYRYVPPRASAEQGSTSGSNDVLVPHGVQSFLRCLWNTSGCNVGGPSYHVTAALSWWLANKPGRILPYWLGMRCSSPGFALSYYRVRVYPSPEEGSSSQRCLLPDVGSELMAPMMLCQR
jgi:hypothetical protein